MSGIDKFRIKIWWEDDGSTEYNFYDNQFRTEGGADPISEEIPVISQIAGATIFYYHRSICK